MKQRISVEQLTELTEAQKHALREWWKPQEGDVCYDADGGIYNYITYVADNGCCYEGNFRVFEAGDVEELPLLSIGQMIELLSSKVGYLTTQNYGKGCTVEYETYECLTETFHYDKPELCDALFEAVKQVLGG